MVVTGRAILVSTLALSLWATVHGVVFDPDTETKVRDLVNQTLKCRHVPGMTLSVVKGDDVWARGFGTADFSADIPVDKTTLFAIGSVTKSFTMVLLGILLTEKKLDWTAKVIDILGPEYGFVDEYRTRESTLKDLLSHRTGLDSLDVGVISGYQKSVTREQLCRNMKTVPGRLPFRDSFIYNNFMYMLLGHVAEKLGGDTWENLVTSRVLQPIGMTSTKLMLGPADVYQNWTAKPYVYYDGEFKNGTRHIYTIHPIEPAGALISNGVDMAKYIRFNLNMGKTDNGKQLLDANLMRKSFNGVVPFQFTVLTRAEFPVSDYHLGYGQAWIESLYNGYRRVWHRGGLFSYYSMLWIFPEQKLGIFGSTNGPANSEEQTNALSTTFYHVTDRLLGHEPWINASTACTFPEPWRAKNPIPSPPVEDSIMLTNAKKYVGNYSSPILSEIHIEADDTSNTKLRFKMGTLGGVLYTTADKDRFLMEILTPWEFYASFLVDNSVTLKMNMTFVSKGDQVKLLQAHFTVPINFTKTDQSVIGGGGCDFCLFITPWTLLFVGIASQALILV